MNKSYDDSNWRSEYIDPCSWRLKARQIELLEKGPDSLSASWLLGAMYQDWKRIKGIPPEPEPPFLPLVPLAPFGPCGPIIPFAPAVP